MQIDGTEIKAAEATTLRLMSTSSTTTVQIDMSIVFTLKELINYVSAFCPQYGVQFASARVKDTVDETVSTKNKQKHLYRFVHSQSGLLRRKSSLVSCIHWKKRDNA